MKAHALVLKAPGTNCDRETAEALSLAGAEVCLGQMGDLLERRVELRDFSILVLPGGFSYGDDVASGKILANKLLWHLRGALEEFVQSGKLVIGICNGFQVLVRLGLLPGGGGLFCPEATLTWNNSGRFMCRWVPLRKFASRAAWLKGVPGDLEWPVAHAEGRFLGKSRSFWRDLSRRGQVPFRYAGENPNGSEGRVAGLCNPRGNVLGLMPHPERFLWPVQHPAWTSQKVRVTGRLFWKGAVDYAKGVKG